MAQIQRLLVLSPRAGEAPVRRIENLLNPLISSIGQGGAPRFEKIMIGPVSEREDIHYLYEGPVHILSPRFTIWLGASPTGDSSRMCRAGS